MLAFGDSYKAILSRLSQSEINLLRKAYGVYQFGPRQNHYLNGNLIATIANVMGSKLSLHEVYPGVFKAPPMSSFNAAKQFADSIMNIKE